MTGARLRLKLIERIEEPGNVLRLRFVDATGAPLAAFGAGAHLNLHLCDGSTDLWRQYSLCSDPAETHCYEIAILIDPHSRGGSIALHRIAQEGTTLEAEGPRNHFPLVEHASKTVLFAGGIGITPMLAMARRLYAINRDFTLHYCTRSQSLTAFRATIAKAPWASKVTFHFDDQSSEQKLNLNRDLPPPSVDTHLYVCGPQGFMDWVIGAAEAAAHDSRNVHREYFSSEIDSSGSGFEVVARKSGVKAIVEPGDTIAKALKRAGVTIDVKCEEGVCGTCVVDVLEGEADHRDKFLTDDERKEGAMLCACCSRSLSKTLILDV